MLGISYNNNCGLFLLERQLVLQCMRIFKWFYYILFECILSNSRQKRSRYARNGSGPAVQQIFYCTNLTTRKMRFLQSWVVNRGTIPKCSQLRDYCLSDIYEIEKADLKELITGKNVALIIDTQWWGRKICPWYNGRYSWLWSFILKWKIRRTSAWHVFWAKQKKKNQFLRQ